MGNAETSPGTLWVADHRLLALASTKAFAQLRGELDGETPEVREHRRRHPLEPIAFGDEHTKRLYLARVERAIGEQ